MNGQPHRDAVTGDRLQAKNVVVQFVKQRVIDEVGRLNITLTGTGEALFFIGGKRIEGRWQRQSESRPFSYEDENGAVIKFKHGQTWVEIVGENLRVRSN